MNKHSTVNKTKIQQVQLFTNGIKHQKMFKKNWMSFGKNRSSNAMINQSYNMLSREVGSFFH